MKKLMQSLIIDHDGGIDDVIAVMLQLLNNPERVKAITIAPADCFDKPAYWIMEQLKELITQASTIPVGIGTNEGENPFPDVWRDDAWKMARMPAWNKNPEHLASYTLDHAPSALKILTKAIEDSVDGVEVLETGPCTNIAELLKARPHLAKKIQRIIIMGGALYVKGNVEEQGHDKSAEWNIYNNPQAFLDILRSGIAITLVPLDATQYTPIRKEFITQLKENTHLIYHRLVHDSLELIKPFVESGEYLFWDTLTSAAVINPAIIKTKKIAINVSINGPSMGKTFEDKQGFEVNVALEANQELFEKTVLDILKK